LIAGQAVMLQIGRLWQIGRDQTLLRQCTRKMPPQRTHTVASLSGGSWQDTHIANLRADGAYAVVPRPKAAVQLGLYAAVLLHRTGRSCVPQQFRLAMSLSGTLRTLTIPAGTSASRMRRRSALQGNNVRLTQAKGHRGFKHPIPKGRRAYQRLQRHDSNLTASRDPYLILGQIYCVSIPPQRISQKSDEGVSLQVNQSVSSHHRRRSS